MTGLPPNDWPGAELHGSSATMHAFVAGEDSFAANLARLEGAQADERAVFTWISRPAMRHLLELHQLLRERGVRRWRMAFLLEGAERLVPRLSMAAPRALQAAKAARDAGIQVELQGAPLCVLGPFRTLLVDGPTRAFASACTRCSARSDCQGVSEPYAARFGDEDLRAQTTGAQRTGSISSQP